MDIICLGNTTDSGPDANLSGLDDMGVLQSSRYAVTPVLREIF